ncbi:hypothetical protein [Halomonas urumqiensis]|uniref:Uncharacterized protein n=1 Tax=Halomonas urumqiensis TaxID=1684789 RepID=A0A2N7UKE4_9GAMM|nr:hypothetical protein [Halomonas urumqiensis]PMR80916.1 hypothetical protein C1H70_07640 [Halomonas urumqiensis]PTB02874.1 hypothetical protein C6V82_09640 [Halomonas urumqiensis]GHE21396.1 hypothetical protein GCM10017767_19170 [Halomonas urumqiensis]
MHKHVDWDDPGADSVMRHFEKDTSGHHSDPGPGDILSARHEGAIVRIKVEAYVEDTSIGEVVALIATDNGRRMKSHGKLNLGDTVRLPDASRALEPQPRHTDDDGDDPADEH